MQRMFLVASLALAGGAPGGLSAATLNDVIVYTLVSSDTPGVGGTEFAPWTSEQANAQGEYAYIDIGEGIFRLRAEWEPADPAGTTAIAGVSSRLDEAVYFENIGAGPQTYTFSLAVLGQYLPSIFLEPTRYNVGTVAGGMQARRSDGEIFSAFATHSASSLEDPSADVATSEGTIVDVHEANRDRIDMTLKLPPITLQPAETLIFTADMTVRVGLVGGPIRADFSNSGFLGLTVSNADFRTNLPAAPSWVQVQGAGGGSDGVPVVPLPPAIAGYSVVLVVLGAILTAGRALGRRDS